MSDLITEAKIMLAQYDGRNRHPGLAQSEHDLARVLRKAVDAIARVEALHAKMERPRGWAVCSCCEVGMLQDPVDWPCPTIEAIGEAS